MLSRGMTRKDLKRYTVTSRYILNEDFRRLLWECQIPKDITQVVVHSSLCFTQFQVFAQVVIQVVEQLFLSITSNNVHLELLLSFLFI